MKLRARGCRVVMAVVSVVGFTVSMPVAVAGAAPGVPFKRAAPIASSSHGHRSSGRFSARLVLRSTTERAGPPLLGTLVVTNHTGQPIVEFGCIVPFSVSLSNAQIHPEYPELLCLQRFILATGISRLAVSVPTSYGGCSLDPMLPLRTCAIPPLPAGKYHARLVWNGDALPKPKPVSVTLLR
jgi:hypothetical protein